MASLGHPCKFQRVLRPSSVTARHSSSGRQPNFAALNRGRHLYLAGRPSRWALAHILVHFSFTFAEVLQNTVGKWPLDFLGPVRSSSLLQLRVCFTLYISCGTVFTAAGIICGSILSETPQNNSITTLTRIIAQLPRTFMRLPAQCPTASLYWVYQPTTQCTHQGRNHVFKVGGFNFLV